ncbi:MAG: hypothetical protein E7052_02050 [Lentisphaerae bacterium]|nr:hypothetical protein [Lentisphaerota bacterium]
MSDFFTCSWAELFESPLAVECELMRAEKQLRSGVQGYAAAEKCRMISLRLQQSGSSVSATAGAQLIFLLSGAIGRPAPGDRITLAGEYYTISSVNICRDLSGEFTVWRCIAG